jgi:hypothetical protein
MDSAWLFDTLVWCVRSCIQLHDYYGATNDVDVITAKIWLRDRPLFRALCREAIRREFTFPVDVYGYLKTYLVEDSGHEPWNDPRDKEQVENLRTFNTEQRPLRRGPDTHGGRPLRNMRMPKTDSSNDD